MKLFNRLHHRLEFLLLADDVQSGQLRHLVIVALQILLTKLNLILLNDELSVIKLPANFLQKNIIIPIQHILIKLLIQYYLPSQR